MDDPKGHEPETEELVERFHTLYYGKSRQTWLNTFWLGVNVAKCPLDLWIYQEILHRTRPTLLIECGTSVGGSALFFASLFDLFGTGRVISIDIKHLPKRRKHPRITYLTGSSTDSEIVSQVRGSVTADDSVMVVLDSNHKRDHVLGECRAYADLVAPGNYLVVEDTNVNGHPVRQNFGPGPMEAVQEFLASDAGKLFEVDRSLEKFFLTFNPGGYLRRLEEPA